MKDGRRIVGLSISAKELLMFLRHIGCIKRIAPGGLKLSDEARVVMIRPDASDPLDGIQILVEDDSLPARGSVANVMFYHVDMPGILRTDEFRQVVGVFGLKYNDGTTEILPSQG